ncbi:NAC transcription factor 29-like [Hevea brasiliensis]|uniref:NAC transcription factor 29-like n=1 Tax=Hevea brasiliensis TaxID=3981 RepID=UPI002600690B|nr:NAC transcription factor 29-like [Hevea brasiliensis]
MEVTQPQSNASVTTTRQPRTDPINDNNRKNFIDIDYFNSFPPGYRFRPLDGELVVHYLKNKIANQPLPPNKIMEVKLYEYNPEKLAGSLIFNTTYFHAYAYIYAMILGVLAMWGDRMVFFTPRDKRYPNGSRPKRDAGGGYWKATGGDKAVKYKGAVVGYRKALVFYMGKPPNGTKTNWIMHEYRVSDAPPRIKTSADDMRLDNVVLCKIYMRDAKDNLRSRLSNEEQSAELDDQTADVVRDVDKNSDPPAYTNALNDNKQIVSIPIQENPSAFYEDPPYVPINNHDHHQAMLEAANYQRAMFAAANYGSYRTYATGMTPPMPEPVQIYPPEDIQIHPTEDIQMQPTEDIVSKYLNENSCEFELSLSPDDWDIISNCLL